MRRQRWPAVPAPTTGGVQIHGGPRILTAHAGMALHLTEIRAYPSGLEIRMLFTADGAAAERARHETRALTDPTDTSARWSYLDVQVAVDDLIGPADPFHPITRSLDRAVVEYRTAPRYWIDRYPQSQSVKITAGWVRLGLAPAMTTVQLGPNPSTRPATR